MEKFTPPFVLQARPLQLFYTTAAFAARTSGLFRKTIEKKAPRFRLRAASFHKILLVLLFPTLQVGNSRFGSFRFPLKASDPDHGEIYATVRAPSSAIAVILYNSRVRGENVRSISENDREKSSAISLANRIVSQTSPAVSARNPAIAQNNAYVRVRGENAGVISESGREKSSAVSEKNESG